MQFLIIQVLLNAIVVVILNGEYLKFYKRSAYILYPVLITLVIVFRNGVSVNEEYWGIAMDITSLLYPSFYVIITLSVIIQILFNTQYLKLLKFKL
jgi:hypothetical protein